MNVTTLIPDHTTPAPVSSGLAQGFIACCVSVVFFGSNFVPVKKFDTGDGVFFQWVMCSAIWLTGLAVHCFRHFPPFYPLAMLGGFLWCTGNIVVVPIIQTIGLSQGLLVWASFNLVVGWAMGRFGIFGTNPEVPKHMVLNYTGMALCFGSAFLYTLLKTNVQSTNTRPDPLAVNTSETSRLISDDTPSDYSEIPPVSVPPASPEPHRDVNLLKKLPPKAQRICALCLAVMAGLLFGVNFTPVIYIQDNYSHNNITASQNGLDYVFAHFSGIYLTSTVYFVLYCVVMRNRPQVYPKAILPAFLSGLMWAIADSAWFIANSQLSEAVAFPIISSGPGIVATIWGMCLFKEITGKRNLLILCVAFLITITGAVLTGLSRVDKL